MSENLENDSRSTKEIIELAALEKDKDNYWNLVRILHWRGSNEEFVAASRLCESQSSKKRSLGVDILAQLGIPQRTFPQQSGDILLKLLSSEENSDVLASIGFAFGHLNDSRSILPLVKLKNSSNANVRYGVVFGLISQEDELAIQALIELSSDEDVRNWATFGLGSQLEIDTQAIRDVLFARIISETGDSDTIAEIRGEALVGLAVRKDERVINPLIAELKSECVGMLAVEAAKVIGDARLHRALIDLENWWDVDIELLQEAISSCKPEDD
ncbi:MAG: hypothetical protein HC815_39805 [Richelia sp. RM1_1_1]|nr:hypothetical protein [Richelia sp. RM1_1_1]